MVSKNSRHEVKGHLDMTLADEIHEIRATQEAYIIERLIKARLSFTSPEKMIVAQ